MSRDIMCYKIYASEGVYFDLEFKFKENADKVCDYLSKRDSKNYYVKEFYYLIGFPEYCDHLMDTFFAGL